MTDLTLFTVLAGHPPAGSPIRRTTSEEVARKDARARSRDGSAYTIIRLDPAGRSRKGVYVTHFQNGRQAGPHGNSLAKSGKRREAAVLQGRVSGELLSAANARFAELRKRGGKVKPHC
jgi:hypothetical protein